MKNEQRQQAQNLYFQTNLSKTEIAEMLGVNRRTIMLWCQEGNWQKLRQSAKHLPALVAEKCYYLIDRFASDLLADHRGMSMMSHHDADVIHKLASSIKKLKNRSTVNESMEMFNFFLDKLKTREPELVARIRPHVEEYMESRTDFMISDALLDGFDKDGTIPYPEKEIKEQWQDERDVDAFKAEYEKTGNYDIALENWQKEENAGTVPIDSPTPKQM